MAQDTGLSPEFLNMRQLLLKSYSRKRRELIKKARAKAGRVAKILKTKYRAREVYLYGSLAWGGFAEGSDIDLLVVGFNGNYWEMYVEAERIARPFAISIVCAEDAFASLKQEVFRKGVLL
ncbi:MAG: nucleotidyltransferase family protein [Desulfotomaculales bacterium]